MFFRIYYLDAFENGEVTKERRKADIYFSISTNISVTRKCKKVNIIVDL